jgi:hypothetical protein
MEHFIDKDGRVAYIFPQDEIKKVEEVVKVKEEPKPVAKVEHTKKKK